MAEMRDLRIPTVEARRHRVVGSSWRVVGMRALLAAFLLAVLAGPLFAQAPEGRRIALVIGVSDYGGQGNLTNPERDARATAETLERLGYDVRTLINPRAAAVDAAIDGLDSATPIQSLLFFFSGHGRRVGGVSLLALGERDPQTHRQKTLDLAELSTRFQRLKAGSTIFVLDACRTETELKDAAGEAGLAPPPRATGTFFAYASAPGGEAFDRGGGRGLSPFTFAFIDELLIPGQDIGVIMRKVRERVSRATGERQVPWSEDALTGPLVINAAPAAPQLFDLYGKALKGDASGARELGLAYLRGQGVAMDVERGAALLRSAAEGKDIAAMLALGAFEASRDQNALMPGGRAREWYGKAAQAGSAEGMFLLAEQDAKRLPEGRKPTEETIALYRRAMQVGHRDATARYLSLNLRFRFDRALDRDATIAALRENAAAENLASMVELGRLYATPDRAETDYREADFWLERAAMRGSAEALLEQAKLFGLGRGRLADPVRAHALTKQAAERGDGLAMLMLGRQYQQGQGVAPDPAEAVSWFRKAVAAGTAEAFADLGHAFEAGLGTDQNPAEAVAQYRRGAALNDAVSTRYLAVMYEQGLGVRRNMDRAIAYYMRAAELGDGRAQASLAVLVNNGMLTSTPDPTLGAAALEKVVGRTRDASYTFRLAQMTEKGVGRPADPARAAELYKQAADLGSVAALSELASLYRLGRGVPRDPVQAQELWQRAASAGDQPAYYNLAVLYGERSTNPEDQAEAGRWARRGAEAGGSEAMTLHARNLYFGEHGQTRDTDGAFGWLERALAEGNGWAAGTLLAIITDGKIGAPQPDRDRALLLLVQAANRQGNTVAAEALRMVWREREGVDMQTATEQALVQRLDGPQRGMAALLLGLGYREGRFGGRPDGPKAARYFDMAIAAGEVEAYRHLGDLHADRMLPDASPREAFRNYQAGAERGEPGAMNNLGVAYRHGLGVTRNFELAFENFKAAAERGHVPAMHNLAVAYQRGFGVSPSPEQAELWYERAIAKGDLGSRLGLVTVLLNTEKEEDRDYARALFNLAELGRHGVPAAATSLSEIVRNGTLPRGVRERAVKILSQLQETRPRGGAPEALKALAAAGIVARSGESYELAQPKSTRR